MLGLYWHSSSGPAIAPTARYSASKIAWYRWDVTSVAVCGVVPIAAMYSAGIATWRIHTGTRGTTTALRKQKS